MQINIIGFGNLNASDDGIGPAVVRSLQYEHLTNSDQEAWSTIVPNFIITSRVDERLLDVINQSNFLILVDAVLSGAKPGTLHHEAWHTNTLNGNGVERISAHGLNTPEVLHVAAALGRLPDYVMLWGIEVATTKPGRELSPKVKAALPEIIQKLYWQLQTICQHPEEIEKTVVAVHALN